MEIGSKGLAEVNLIIPQNTSLTFDIEHTDEDGVAVDHTGSIINMSIQSKSKAETTDLSGCCAGTDTGVHVELPPSVSEAIDPGKYNWDMIVETPAGDAVRMAYGTVTIVDTYAKD